MHKKRFEILHIGREISGFMCNLISTILKGAEDEQREKESSIVKQVQRMCQCVRACELSSFTGSTG